PGRFICAGTGNASHLFQVGFFGLQLHGNLSSQFRIYVPWWPENQACNERLGIPVMAYPNRQIVSRNRNVQVRAELLLRNLRWVVPVDLETRPCPDSMSRI
ncbi:MAG TPA: hypothetical protein VK513_18665, partial [Terriglobales bacterium]|nr:hypothetical protein [Terriglobales bacterium]